MFDPALAQVPAPLRRPDEHGRMPVLVRTDGAGATKAFAAHVAAAGAQFSLGANLGHFDIPGALVGLPKTVWTPASPARKPRAAEHGVQIEPRDGAWVAEATRLVDMSAWPPDTRPPTRRPDPDLTMMIT